MTDAQAPPADAPPPAKPGRPSSYTPELAETICGLIAEGQSLRSICARDDMPGKTTVLRWLGAHEAFRTQYAHAREMQADRLFEECLEIADETSGDFTVKENDNGSTYEVVDHEYISRSRLRVDTRKWMAGKLAPKKYGEKVALEHAGKDGAPLPAAAQVIIFQLPDNGRG